MTIVCDYCGRPAELVTGEIIYPHRRDLYRKRFWLCRPCKAYVGCHPRTDRPLGRLADEELRRAKMDAHRAFDPLWKSGRLSRSDAYRRLAEDLGIPIGNCHIGMFDVETCRAVIKAAKRISRAIHESNLKRR